MSLLKSQGLIPGHLMLLSILLLQTLWVHVSCVQGEVTRSQCLDALGMQSGDIPDQAITASSRYVMHLR